MLTASALKALLRAHHLRLTKRLGQHHLIDARMIERIVEGCQLSSQDTVVEIGAGLGALTEVLAGHARRLIAVEVDARIAALLRDRMAAFPNVEVDCRDILTFPWERVRSAVVMGAIPYSIPSPILVALAEQRAQVQRIILIVQEAVADRLLAAPSTKAYGRLTLLAQYCWRMEPLLRIPRSAFFPQPDVDSTCLRFIPHPQPPVGVRDERVLFQVIKTAFGQRRKSLVNCLRPQLDGAQARATCGRILQALGFSALVRGEALSLAQFAALTNALTDAGLASYDMEGKSKKSERYLDDFRRDMV